MHVTVAICTWNRCELLRQTLERIASALVVPPGLAWELLVVNNHSTDDTDRVIEQFAARLPLRRLHEPRQGLAHARNRALAEARGEYLVWTDDDVLVDARWLQAYQRAFTRRPDAAVFGGPVEPWFPAGPPAWLAEVWAQVCSTYAVRDLGPEEVPLSGERLPFGANMAVRTREQRRVPFDAQLGHCADDRVGGEETRALRRILAEGATGWWVPEARVRHCIPEERQTLGYLRSYYRGRGVRLYREQEENGERRRSLAWWAAQAAAGELGFRLGRSLQRSRWWIRAGRRSWIARGYLAAALRSQDRPGDPRR